MNGNRNGNHVEPSTTDQTDRRLVNPFTTWSHKQVLDCADAFIIKSGLAEYSELFRKGASLAQSSKLFDSENYDGLKLLPRERDAIRLEFSQNRLDRFRQPLKLYGLVACCSLGAAVQGWYVENPELFFTFAKRTPGIKPQ